MSTGKTSINSLIPGKFGPKNEIYSQCYEIWHSEQVKFVNHKYGIWNCGSWLEIKSMGRSGLTIAMSLTFRKFGTQNKSTMLIINILIGIDDLDLKLQICEIWSQNWNLLRFLWNLAFTTNWTCLFMITRRCLECPHDNSLKMIIGSEHGTIIRTIYNSSMLRMIIGCKIRVTVRTWLIALAPC